MKIRRKSLLQPFHSFPGYSATHLELTFEDLSYGASGLCGFFGTLFFSVLVVLHINNLVVAVTFSTISMTQVNHIVSQVEYPFFITAVMNILQGVDMRYEGNAMIFRKNMNPIQQEIFKIYKGEMAAQGLAKENLRVTYTFDTIRMNVRSSKFVP